MCLSVVVVSDVVLCLLLRVVVRCSLHVVCSLCCLACLYLMLVGWCVLFVDSCLLFVVCCVMLLVRCVLLVA